MRIASHPLKNDYEAKVTDIAHDLDLALLAVQDESFWTAKKEVQRRPGAGSSVRRQRFPAQNEEIWLVGYPFGGTSI